MDKDSKSAGKKPYPAAKNGNQYAKTGEKRSFSHHNEKKSFGKPSEKTGEKRYGKPAGNPGERSFRPRQEGDRAKPYGRKPDARPAVKKPADPNAPSSLSRKVALDIFQDVIHKDAFAALSLDERMKNVNLSQLDKRFCASIVYRTIENLIRIDYALSFFLRDAEALEPTVRDILRISACQLLFHDRIPENAVVDEAVKLTRGAGLEGLTGLTNAVLRSLIRGKDEIKWPAEDEGARYLSIM